MLLVMLFVLKKCLLHFLLLVMLFADVAKRSNSSLKTFFKTDVFRNFAILIHRKIAVLEPLFNNVSGLKACIFIKKRLQHRCFSMNIAKFLGTVFL